MQSYQKAALVAGVFLAKDSVATSVTPVQKVIELMSGMLATGKEEKHQEEVAYASSKQFCDDTSAEKQGLIADGNDRIMKLNADIEKHGSDFARLGKEITKHEEDIATWEGEVKAATAARKTQQEDYDRTHKDQSESIDAIERAIATMKEQAHTRAQAGSSFVQLSSSQTSALRRVGRRSPEAQRTIDAFLALKEAGGSVGALSLDAPEAAGYEFQSQGIVEMLVKLEDQFIADRTTLETEERNQKQAFEMAKADLQSSIKQANQDVTEKTQFRATAEKDKAQAENDLADTTATRDADQKYLDELTASCNQKASDFASKQDLRAGEIKTLTQVIEILSSSDVAGNAGKHLPALLQEKKRSALGQLRTARAESEGARRSLTEFLQQAGQRLNSKLLSSLASSAAEDPFVKVRKMIKDLIVRLMEEANEEAEQKGWCDTELTTNEQTRKEKTAAVETLHAEIDQLEASISQLNDDINKLTQAVADLDAAMAKATELRQQEKATNDETLADSKAAQGAVSEAMKILQEFYAAAGDNTAGYQGNQSGSGNALSFLEVILTDFARLQSETEAAEETAQTEYDQFTTDSQVDKDSKNTDLNHKQAKKQDQTQALTLAHEDLVGTQKELDTALAYFDKLKPTCVDAGVSYDDRVARREEEIQSMKEALEILNGKTV